jgi:signal transduction histidine kinase/DNA-binding NarL/FixJ family response regulator/HPt (histidine-containing phosphotransfer) domain-containing protein
MKMGQKLTLGFVGIASLVVCVGFVSIKTSQRVLHERIGQASSALANEIICNVDKTIYTRIEMFQEYVQSLPVQRALSESNRAFDAVSDVSVAIDQQDRDWIAAGPEETTDFMLGIINNALSQDLRGKAQFYNRRCHYKVFGELFVTNKYGVNVAQTGKTSDYCQADERWWQQARQQGLYMGRVAYDDSADVYSTDICLRIDDPKGDFLGVAKVVLNVEESMALIQEAISENSRGEFKLLNRDWCVIYTLDDYDFLESLGKGLMAQFQQCERGKGHSYFVAEGDNPGEGDELYGYAHSRGYKDYQGLGWILAVEQETKKIYASVDKLKFQILAASAAVSILAIGIGLAISRPICHSLSTLTSAATQIGQGKLDLQVDVTTKDEIGFLAHAFNDMVHNLADITTSKESLAREVALHQRTEEELRCTKAELENQLSELTLIQDAGLNMMEDICSENTERKQAEKMLEQAKKEAEAANESKSQFLANMSHEIRTPMNAIMGFSEILAGEPLTEQQQDYVNTICNGSKYLLQVINDILDFSKIDAGKMDVTMGQCGLGHLLAMVESLMRPIAQEKGLPFECLMGEDLPTHLVTDSERLQQCLINLVNNAIKFTEAGHVYVHVALEVRSGDPFIRFDIEDTGIGIPKKKQEDIFLSFNQADGSTSRKYGGTGLGLAITKQLAGLLGGEIGVTSELGIGSTFTLIIPAGLDVTRQSRLDKNRLKEQTLAQDHKRVSPVLYGHVLVAEDVTANQRLIRLLLERMNLKVTVADDGSRAAQKALAHRFDLILMDIQMPHMNGHDATRTLRASGITTPIIALTAHAMMGDIEECLASGCNGYLSKPISVEQLKATISPYLSDQPGGSGTSSEALVASVPTSISVDVHQDRQSPVCQTIESGTDQIVECPFDWDHLVDQVGDEDIAQEILSCYLQDGREQLTRLAEAIEGGDAEETSRGAHALKGASANFGAKRMAEIAYQLEQAGLHDEVASFTSLFETLSLEFDRLSAFFSREDWLEIAKGEKALQ